MDGLLVLRDFFDTLRDEPCGFEENGAFHTGRDAAASATTPPSYWCLPQAMARHDEGVGPYGDPDCTVPIGLAPGTGSSPTYVRRVSSDACASIPVIHRAGPQKMMSPWILDHGLCVQASARVQTHAIEESIPIDAFVRGEERVEDPISAAERSFEAIPRESRVASLVVVTTDGARQTIGGFDRKRSAAARFEDPGGAEPPRWVPSRVAFQGAGEVFYGDDKCTMPVPTKIARDAVCPLSAVRVFQDQCGHSSVYEIGAPLDRSRLHDFSGAACVTALAPGVLTFEIGAVIASNELPAAYVTEAGGDFVRRRGYASTSGVVVTWGDLVDVATKESCAPHVAIDTKTRCLPLASASVNLFADDACTLPAFAEPLTGCERGPPPRFVRASIIDEEAGARVFEVVGDATNLFELRAIAKRQDETYSAFQPIVASRGFAVKEVPSSRFPLVEERN